MIINDTLHKMTLSVEMERTFEWRKWSKKIPYVHFKKEWQVTIIPPRTGAIVRFLVSTDKLEKLNRRSISIYLDCYGILGDFWQGEAQQPYWEVYPYDGDVFRCAMNDTGSLIDAISDAIKLLEKEV